MPKESAKDKIEEHKEEREGSKESNIIMYIYRALINAQSTHIIHINLNMILYTHVEHNPIKNSLHKILYGNTQTQKHTQTHTQTQTDIDTDTDTDTHTHARTHARTHAHTHTHTHTH